MKIAHRGTTIFAPENTLPALEKAIELGAEYVEIDVRYSSDNVPVLIHDPEVDRTTNGSGNVGELTLAELKQLDAGFWFGDEFAGTRIPTLAVPTQPFLPWVAVPDLVSVFSRESPGVGEIRFAFR